MCPLVIAVRRQAGTRGNPRTPSARSDRLSSRREVPDPIAWIRAILNVSLQDSTTAKWSSSCGADLVHNAAINSSRETDRHGTPAGVVAFRDPPVFMQPGDEVTIEIATLGALTNPVR